MPPLVPWAASASESPECRRLCLGKAEQLQTWTWASHPQESVSMLFAPSCAYLATSCWCPLNHRQCCDHWHGGCVASSLAVVLPQLHAPRTQCVAPNGGDDRNRDDGFGLHPPGARPRALLILHRDACACDLDREHAPPPGPPLGLPGSPLPGPSEGPPARGAPTPGRSRPCAVGAVPPCAFCSFHECDRVTPLASACVRDHLDRAPPDGDHERVRLAPASPGAGPQHRRQNPRGELAAPQELPKTTQLRFHDHARPASASSRVQSRASSRAVSPGWPGAANAAPVPATTDSPPKFQITLPSPPC